MPPFRSQCICLLLLLLLPLGAPEIAVADSAAPPEDADAIQSGMEQILVSLDAAAYAKSVSYAEHVVIAYQRAQHREPTPEEFIVLSVRQGRPIFKRSEVLAMALRRDEAALTWDQCREFLKKRTPKDFRSSAATRAIARQLAKTSLSSVTQKDILKKACFPQPAQGRKAKTAPVIPGEEYNVYFGYTHAHSGLSDGSGTPEEAYAYARDEGDLDFFSLTDHAEQLELWPWENKWQRLKCAAEAVYAPGTFVSLWGFALQLVLMQWHLLGYDARAVTFYVLIGMTAGVVAWWMVQGMPWDPPGMQDWATILVLGVVSTYAARLLQFNAVTRIGGGQTSMLSPVETLLAVIWSMLFLGERLSLIQAAGGVLILLSAVLAMQRLKRARFRPRWRLWVRT